MKISEVSNILSEYLGLPQSSIFEENKQQLSDFCLGELERVVALPGGFKFSSLFRRPEKGEFFLDLRALVSENRLLVYKAISDGDENVLIMTSGKSSSSLEKVSCGYVAVLNHKHRLILVHVDELSNTLDTENNESLVLTDSFLGITSEDRKHVDQLIKEVTKDLPE